ncbi:MAG: exodeoxyribonuclease VII large subunit, partial [Arenimonas sp.]|nr:exodeoxyribonuclease VII large subunit [Arenimonas sp.]
LLVPERGELLARLSERLRQLQALHARMQGARAQRADQAFLKLQALRPQLRLERGRSRLAALHRRLDQAVALPLASGDERLGKLLRRLDQGHPSLRLQAHRHRLALLRQQLATGSRRRLEQPRLHLQGLARALEGVSPLATLGRGYAILQRESDRAVVRHAADTAPGERLLARLAQGQLRLRVEPSED